MRLLGNILWLLLGGLFLAAGWAIIGLVLCVTIIGIPLGIQAFKMAGLTLTPFGKTVVYGGGVGSVLINIVWFVLANSGGFAAAGIVDDARLRVRRTAELHYHHRHSVWHPVVQDGQTGAVAVWFANLRPVEQSSLSRPDGLRHLTTLGLFDFRNKNAYSCVSISKQQ